MFEQFNEGARQALVLSRDEGRLLGHNHIGTEHILLGLLSEEEGIAAQSLNYLGVGLEDARLRVRSLVAAPAEPAPAGGIAFTRRAKAVLEAAMSERLEIGSPNIGTEHLLLGLIRVGLGVGLDVISSFEIDLAQLRYEVLIRDGTKPVDELRRLQEQLHVLQGLSAALDRWDEISALAGAARDARDAARALCAGPLNFSAVQAQHILDMTVGARTADRRESLNVEISRVEAAIRRAGKSAGA